MPDQSTKLSSLIKVRPSGIRSIHVERDLQQPSLVSEYVFTAQARRTLARIVDGVADSAHARAWTLTGPYLNSAGSTSSGEADSLLEAKAAFRQAFDRWLKWAVGKEKLAVWFA